jgi:hypothetical protein
MAPHYEFFQRRTVHVNSQVLLSSTHPRPVPRHDFRGALSILQAVVKLRSESLAAVEEFAGECGCAGRASENPVRQTDIDTTTRAQQANFPLQSCSGLRPRVHPVAIATVREISPRRFSLARSYAFPASTAGCVR